MDFPHFEINQNDLDINLISSPLYNIEPIGTSTPYIECLTSYVIRLAEAHSVTPGTIIGKIITPLLNKHYLTKVASRGGGGIYKSASSINGIRTAAIDLVRVIEGLTSRNHLHHLTMLTWSKVLPTRGLLKSKKAWCPICLEEWKKSNSPIYEPLIWLIQDVKICLKHKIHLHTICPNCKKEIPTLSRNSQHGYCSYCLSYLVEEKEGSLLSKKIDFWDIWRAKNVGELLENMYSIKAYPDKNRIKEVLTKALEECAGGVESQFIRMLDIPIATFKSWMGESKKPSLSYILRISYCLGISLKQFLTEEIKTLEFNIHHFDYESYKRGTANQKFPEGYIEKELHYWATSVVNPPPSVKEIAIILGCDRRLLYKKGPELCKLISQRYLKYIKKNADERVESLKKRVIDTVKILNNRGIYPSRRKVEEYLKMPGVIKEGAIRSVWKQEIEKVKRQT